MSIIKKLFGIDPQARQTVDGTKRSAGFLVEKVDRRTLNQLLFELNADHVIGNATHLSLDQCTVVFQSSDQTFRDSQGAEVTFEDGDKIAWRGLDTLTASIDISTIDDLEHVMFQGVTIDLGSFDMDLGENQRGELDLSGSGTFASLSSDGLRIKSSGGLVVDNQDGDIIVDNDIISPTLISPTLDFTADSKGIFKGLEAVVYRLNTSVTNSDDPVGGSGGEWEVADDTESEFYLGATGISLIEEGLGTLGNGEFGFKVIGHFLIICMFMVDLSGDGTLAQVGLEVSDDIGGTDTFTKISGPSIEGAANSRILTTCFGLIKTTTIASENAFKLSFDAGAATQQLLGDTNHNRTAFMVIKLADL